MLVTDSGIETLVRPLQPKKASPPILVTEFGIVILVSPVQREKADPPILVTESGMITEAILSAPYNAPVGMDVVPSAKTTSQVQP